MRPSIPPCTEEHGEIASTVKAWAPSPAGLMRTATHRSPGSSSLAKKECQGPDILSTTRRIPMPTAIGGLARSPKQRHLIGQRQFPPSMTLAIWTLKLNERLSGIHYEMYGLLGNWQRRKAASSSNQNGVPFRSAGPL